ncbi:MAG: retron system putative HNH endonuclease [Candidatus Muiribacteriota bacterium]
MKYIVKGSEPEEFTKWKNKENEDWKPEYSLISSDLKNDIKLSLMKEQGFLCCYCERRLENYDSHIEHFNPRSNKEVDPLDYSNMICSCQNRLKPGEPRHCGNLKGDWFDYEQLISPFEKKCAKRFTFSADGRIKPYKTSDNAAKITIKKLGLDIPKLRALRKKTLEVFIDTDFEDLPLFVSKYLKLNSDGSYNEFYTAVEFVFRDYKNL